MSAPGRRVHGLVAGVVLSALPGVATAQATLPRDVEVRLALSALPGHLRDGATVLVFEAGSGFVTEREGTNGFHAMVSRVEPAVFRATWAYEAHPDDVLLPIAFDAAGVGGPMQPFLDAARLIAEGTSAQETKRRMRDAFAAGRYPPAPRAGIAFMLAPVLRAQPDPLGSPSVFTVNVPHRMFYAPFVSNADVGGDRGAPLEPFVIQRGPHGYIGLRAGPTEVAAINAEHQDLIRELCALDARWCLS